MKPTEVPASTNTDARAKVRHVFCPSDLSKAVCGAPSRGENLTDRRPPQSELCVVCLDLMPECQCPIHR